jgi:hypothetical protein
VFVAGVNATRKIEASWNTRCCTYRSGSLLLSWGAWRL